MQFLFLSVVGSSAHLLSMYVSFLLSVLPGVKLPSTSSRSAPITHSGSFLVTHMA